MKLLSHVGAILNHRFVAYRTTRHLREISHAALVDNSSRVLTDFLRTGKKKYQLYFPRMVCLSRANLVIFKILLERFLLKEERVNAWPLVGD